MLEPMIITALGLSLDLIGVTILGIDLVRVQSRIKRQAADDFNELEDISEEFGGVESWLSELSKQGDWRDWHLDEGVVMLDGTFDADRAKESFKEAIQSIETVHLQTNSLARLLGIQIKSAVQLHSTSLVYSYLGLVLIVSGFILQLAALAMGN